MGFSVLTKELACDRQGGLCAYCGKQLVWENQNKGMKGAWHAHHKKPLAWDGSDLLHNCAILCINEPHCHLRRGHGGDYGNYVQLYDYELPYLYAGEE